MIQLKIQLLRWISTTRWLEILKYLIDEFWIANENNKTRSITVNNTNKN